MSHAKRLRQGFTLLELSIVLVIIGLLIGGIFVGQSLIHTAQINSAITELRRYQTATQNFIQQYQAIPGDITNATKFWGAAGGDGTGNDSACRTIESSTLTTCNGNGDGLIVTSTASYEANAFWHHLANAKMIEGQYNGTQYIGGVVQQEPGNVPASNMPGAGWGIYNSTTGAAGAFDITGLGTNDFVLGGMVIGGYVWPNLPIMTPKDAWSIDKKIDDGLPAQGNAMVQTWASCTNAVDKTTITATYVLTDTNKDCHLHFAAGF